jgi:alkylation response protein AidB-like acyl-CoA dehydrogenase
VRYEGVPARRVAGAAALAALVRLGRALAAVQCVGAMEQALDATVRYARVREQFGRPIASFQAVRHHCANMAIRVASARLLAFEALSALDAGTASDAQVALAKASASRAAPEVLMLAHQIHGGNGVIEENDLYFFTLRGKERSLAWGSAEECLAVAAAAVAEPAEWF